MNQRGSGLLLHVSSLHTPFGIGDMGPSARAFADFLHEAGQRFWQILPLNPTDPDFDNSPYRSLSAFAFSPLLISLDVLVEEGLLDAEDIARPPRFPKGLVDYEKVAAYKWPLLDKAFSRFVPSPDFQAFCTDHAHWLEDYALFVAFRSHFGDRPWTDWPAPVRDRDPAALAPLRESLATEIQKIRVVQYLFLRQWRALKDYCASLGIQIIGDIPIYVAMDSVDVWTHPEIFKLDAEKRPLMVSGVPPDYFSETGQLWGNPVYRWDVMQKDGYGWWLERIGHNLRLFDIVRIDHFRGFVAFWEVPAGEPTAINGAWIEAPAEDFIQTLQQAFSPLPIIAEDLGLITPDVVEIMRTFNLPGMRVLQFAFSGDPVTNEHLPHNLKAHSFLFTGTHDNNTTRGWYTHDATDEERRNLAAYLGKRPRPSNVHWTFIRLALASVANTVVIPVQDILGLGQRHRMNMPSLNQGNWKWRIPSPNRLGKGLSLRLASLSQVYGRRRHS